MDKRATIGTTLTWVLAMFILMFAMFLYVIAVGAITSSDLGKTEHKANVKIVEENFYQAASLISFAELNREEISVWADSEGVITDVDLHSGDFDKDLAVIYSVLGDSASDFNNKLKIGFMCFEVGEKTMIVDGHGAGDFSWRVGPLHEQCDNFKPSSYEIFSELYVASDDGKLVKLIYGGEDE